MNKRILVIGGNGLLGSSIIGRLLSEGYEVVAVGRRPVGVAHARIRYHRLDLANTRTPADWQPYLTGIQAVVNCTGVLQDSGSDSTSVVHHEAPSALFRACAAAGIRRVIHFSALGVERHALTKFSTTKRAGDEALMQLDLDWVVLRPSVVIGRRAYGATALMRGLAALPLMPSMPDTAEIQPVYLADVVDTVMYFMKEGVTTRRAIELVGPRRMTFDQAVAMVREWLGWRPARRVKVPAIVANVVYRLGDAAAWFGWRPPVRSNARLEMTRGATGTSDGLTEATGIVPRDIATALLAEPASVQERWFSRLYLLKPAIFTVFPAFWIATGLISLGPGRERGIELVMEGGTSYTVALLATLSGGLADIVIGLLIAFRKSARLGLYAAFAISVAYAIIGTILVPRLWIDPLGPMLKIAPVMVFNLVALAVLEDR